MISIFLILLILLLLLKRFKYKKMASLKNEYFVIAICVYLLLHMRQVKAQYEYYTSDDKSRNPLSINGSTHNIDPDSNYYTNKIIDAFLKNEGGRRKLFIPGDLKITGGNVVLSNDLTLKADNKLDGINGSPIENWNPLKMTQNRWQNVPTVNVHSDKVIKSNTVSVEKDIRVEIELRNINNNKGKTEVFTIHREGATLDVWPHVQIFGAINLSTGTNSPYNREDSSSTNSGHIYRDNENVRLNDD